MNKKAAAEEMHRLMFLFKRQGEGQDEADHHDGITHRDLMFLNGIRQIHEGELVKMSELSSNFRITPAAISQIVRDLENRNLVERVTLDSDRRSVYVKHTQHALDLIKKHEDEVYQRMMNLFQYLGEEDSETLLRIMRRCVDFAKHANTQK